MESWTKYVLVQSKFNHLDLVKEFSKISSSPNHYSLSVQLCQIFKANEVKSWLLMRVNSEKSV